MLVKMRESKGFTLVELMIVVAIIGILAAVAVPYYQRYVAKSRLTSLVMPSVHSFETNISTFFAVQNTMPQFSGTNAVSIDSFLTDADTHFATISSAGTSGFKIQVLPSATNSSGKAPLKALGDTNKCVFYAVPEKSSDNNKLYWKYTGTLATELGL